MILHNLCLSVTNYRLVGNRLYQNAITILNIFTALSQAIQISIRDHATAFLA